MEPTAIHPMVRAQAEILDRLEPGWRKRIDLATFKMRSFSRCVLGQLYPSSDFQAVPDPVNVAIDWAVFEGECADDDTGETFETEPHWRAVIEQRPAFGGMVGVPPA